MLIGDRGRDQVVNLHYMLGKLSIKPRPTVLWCYKKDLAFSSNQKKRMKKVKKRVAQGIGSVTDDPFSLFVASTHIRKCYYSETHKILGNTFGMCVLQDFESLTPNLLARTIETVEGGGLIVMLVRKMSSLKQLYSLTMDVHARYRTPSQTNVVGRFNERFLLSLGDCRGAIVADDELNVLPLSSHVRSMTGKVDASFIAKAAITPELKTLKSELEDQEIIGPLVEKTVTVDQAEALMRFEEVIQDKTLRATIALTASRGRGKSASLGLAVAAAVAHGYSNIFVTSPSPENLQTYFKFLFIGLNALGYTEHADYELIKSVEQGMKDIVVRVNIYREHRQTVQYIDPTEARGALAQAELLVIDEAAAIPLPVVKKLFGPYLIFICSTVTGYEGTGRSLSLKLLEDLRVSSGPGKGRTFREVQMKVPIRYAENDPIENWLYDILCLKAGSARQTLTSGAPHPDKCDLYYVERDTLFSRHRASEAFLHRVMSLFVSSHYKNSPNDLQMLSDAPGHALFVLLAPTDSNASKLPDVLVAIQVALEGRIGASEVKSSLSRGQRASGDMIPWTISQQYQDTEFASLAGARVVRIATNPEVTKMGYGTRAIKLLKEYYSGANVNLSNANGDSKDEETQADTEKDVANGENDLLTEIIGPRSKVPPLLRRLSERSPEMLDYLGVSFGLTQALYNFWSRSGFFPLYIRLTANDLTGEHSCIMASALGHSSNQVWLSDFNTDFRRRFVSLLGYSFRTFTPGLALSIIHSKLRKSEHVKTIEELKSLFTPYDLRRLDSYARNLVDYHVVVDMLPAVARTYFLDGFELSLSPAQGAILVSLGLQHCTVDDLQGSLDLPALQILALFNKVMRKVNSYLRQKEVHSLVSPTKESSNKENGVEQPADDDNKLKEDAQMENTSRQQPPESTGALRKYKIGEEEEWSKTLNGKNPDDPQTFVSVKKVIKKDKKSSKKSRKSKKRA